MKFSMALKQLQPGDRERILAIAHNRGVTSLKVFGSLLRDEARPDSDLDLLVEAGPNTTPFFPGGLVADLEDALGQPGQLARTRGLAQRSCA